MNKYKVLPLECYRLTILFQNVEPNIMLNNKMNKNLYKKQAKRKRKHFCKLDHLISLFQELEDHVDSEGCEKDISENKPSNDQPAETQEVKFQIKDVRKNASTTNNQPTKRTLSPSNQPASNEEEKEGPTETKRIKADIKVLKITAIPLRKKEKRYPLIYIE